MDPRERPQRQAAEEHSVRMSIDLQAPGPAVTACSMDPCYQSLRLTMPHCHAVACTTAITSGGRLGELRAPAKVRIIRLMLNDLISHRNRSSPRLLHTGIDSFQPRKFKINYSQKLI